MNEMGKVLIGLGALLVVVGAVVLLAGRFNLPLGRLPGDLAWRSKSGNPAFYFPIVTCIALSVLLTVVLWIINAIRK